MPAAVAPIEARRLWTYIEPIHDVTYFCPQPRAAFEAANLRGFWRGYFAGRAAPLGPVGPGPVIATFFGFAPRMVLRALPDVWSRITPEAALDVRREGARRAIAAVLPPGATDDLGPVLAQVRRATEALDPVGRPLGAANADLPWPDEPLDQLWHAATMLREHRGDGHVAALLTAGLDGCAAIAWHAARNESRELMQANRGWTDEEWDEALDRLVGWGWLAADHTPTAAGLAARDGVELTTDRLAAAPWRRLGESATADVVRALTPIAKAVAVVLPQPNPLGLAVDRG